MTAADDCVNMGASMNWLAAHALKYQGQWIAVCNGYLLATAETLEQLEKALEGHNHENTIVVRVLPNERANDR